MTSSDADTKDRFENILEFSTKRLTNHLAFSSNENNKKHLYDFLNETDRSERNRDGARLYCEMMECYIITQKYNVPIKDILQ